MGYHSFDWRAWSIKPENKKIIAENMAKAVSKFKREQYLWEAKYEYLEMAYNPQSINTQNPGTSAQTEIESDLAAFAFSLRSVSVMVITSGGDEQNVLSEDGTLVYETSPSVFRGVFKIYS